MLSCSLKRFLQTVNKSKHVSFRLCSTTNTEVVPTTENAPVQGKEVFISHDFDEFLTEFWFIFI